MPFHSPDVEPSFHAELKAAYRELERKIETVRQTYASLEHLMDATRTAAVFLDREMRIERYSPEQSNLLRVGPADVGRPLATLADRFDLDGLQDRAKRVLETATPFEQDVRGGNGTWFLARLHPYRVPDETVAGVLLTFQDMSERRALQRELVEVCERERRQVARELHDELASDLIALTMKGENISRRLDGANEAAQVVVDLIEGTRAAAQKTRRLSHDLMPVALQEEHLAAGLEHLCREQEARLGVRCLFEGEREEPLPTQNELAMHLFQIAHEAIATAARHSGASTIRVALLRTEDALVLRVRDDGTGPPDQGKTENGLGLRMMQYRADLIGASLTVTSSDEGGGLVQTTLPLHAARPAPER